MKASFAIGLWGLRGGALAAGEASPVEIVEGGPGDPGKLTHFLTKRGKPQRLIREERVDGAGSKLLRQRAAIGAPKGLMVSIVGPAARGKGDRQHESRRKAARQGATGNKRGHGFLGLASFRL